MIGQTRWFIAFLAISPTFTAAAATLRPEAPITAVTVFPGQAEITRTLEFDLPAGRHSLLVGGLPANLLPESLRLRPLRADGLEIGAVDLRRRFQAEGRRREENQLRRELLTLSDRQRELDDGIKAHRLRLEFISALGREMPKGFSRNDGGEMLLDQDWRQTWTLLGDGAAKAMADIRQAEQAKRDLQRRGELLQKKLRQLGRGRAEHLTAQIALTATTGGRVAIGLRYQVAGAGWRPIYDLRLNSETEAVTLVQSAMVRQSTGEDWSDVDLTLSTTRPGRGGALPVLNSWFVDVLRPTPQGTLQDAMPRTRALAAKEADANSEDRLEEKKRETGADIVAGEFAALYKVRTPATLPSGGERHRFPLAERAIATELSVLAVPKLQPHAYLYGKVAYDGAEPLLPGVVAIYRDGTYVGRGRLPTLRPGQKVNLSFGIDDRVRVSRRQQTGQRSHAGLFNDRRRHERRYLLQIANHHARPMRITVQDQLPTPRDGRIEVELLDDTTPPSERDVDDRRGVLAWSHDYAPGEERTLRFGFAILHPEDVRVAGF
ncbi:MAG: mucoidy inhibitor MuiA family protein [Alphaproteobacteria bacterium]|nr:mucoidy inhibitor MuiA family protein [Alphaproteobacteria bacterium]MDP6567118.1 mucoidy inhibitor MuiA family protein [Alphaproteobacteria bacterium]MDP6813134.1 mucoidy inhibitor MuiA family protein [Alphaproteobacteria bacterium]